ncbi:MAG: response regulator, partial [Xanthobacteraceae bacterium]
MLPTRMTTGERTAYPPSWAASRAATLAKEDCRAGKTCRDAVRVLIVEDDFIAAIDMEAVLTEAGFQVAGIADRADEAVRLAKSESPTLAIMDIRLIGKADGVDAALEIFRETGIRCIFATAHHDARMRSRAEPAAPLGWLPKPYG